MSLRDQDFKDQHLAKALAHAPDRDVAPSEVARKNVLEYANKSSKQVSQRPHGYWLAGLLPDMKNWQWAGMSSVAVALLAALMLREQLPPEMTQPKVTQREAAPKVLAQNTAPEKMLKEERLDAAEYSAAKPAAGPPTAVTRAQDQAKAETSAAASVLADSGSVVAAAPAAQSVSPPPAPAAQELAKQDKSVAVESNDRLETAPADAAVSASAEQKEGDAKPAAAAKKSVMLVDAGALGVAKANRDIQAGVLRILVAEWPADKALLDEATGYHVEVVTDLVSEELAAYNQTMRDWYLQQK